MRFERFQIYNFKGIERGDINLVPTGSNIFTLVGLNESGKTTVLEAINAFGRTSDDTKALYSNDTGQPNPTSFVPKHQKSNFTGKIRIVASVAFEAAEKDALISEVQRTANCAIDPSSVPDRFGIESSWTFENSDLASSNRSWHMNLSAKAKGERKYRPQDSESPIWKTFWTTATKKIPDVVYFPTFLFSQPDRILLNPGDDETTINRVYRVIIENVAKSLERPLDIKKHIVDRLIREKTATEKVVDILLLEPDKQEQVNAALTEISTHLTQTVFDSWSKIFGGNFSGREVLLRLTTDKSGPSPRVYVQFALKDRTSTYHIGERSLGFRWFFSFLLFTLYRVSARNDQPTLFLLDEPASNLHSRAQMQLLDSLPKIATGTNQIMYSTHSHYMINPDWLDQAFIVSNKAVDYDDVTDRDAASKKLYTDIHIDRYRNFVGSNPDKTTYFQPVLDKLEVTPSRLDLLRKSVLVEGKGDYLILEYVRRVVLGIEESFAVVPTRGADGLDELIGLFLGWGVPFVICLDADKKGLTVRDRYVSEWGIPRTRALTLADVSPDLAGKAVEGLLEDDDLTLISNHYGITKKPSKSQVQLFFSEALASKRTVAVSKKFRDRVQMFEDQITAALK